MNLDKFMFDITQEAAHLCDELRYAYLYLYSMEKAQFNEKHKGFCVDNVGEENEYNIVYDITTLPAELFPKITEFRKTDLGRRLGHAAFFTETDTRSDKDEYLDYLDMHKHVESTALINFPLVNCNDKTTIGFHVLSEEEESNTHLCDLGGVYLTNDRWWKEPDIKVSTYDNHPYILNAYEWHSVQNKASAKRIVGGWYFKRDANWEDLLLGIREDRKNAQHDA